MCKLEKHYSRTKVTCYQSKKYIYKNVISLLAYCMHILFQILLLTLEITIVANFKVYLPQTLEINSMAID